MKLYDIILNNTDIKNFCANEKGYYFKLLRQMTSLMNNNDISEYRINLSNEHITNLTVTDNFSNTSVYSIITSHDGSVKKIRGEHDENSGHDKIIINKIDERHTTTDAFIQINDNTFVDIEYWNILDEPHQKLDIRTLYNGNPTDDRSFCIQRSGYFRDNKTYNFKMNNSSKSYEQDINSLLIDVIKEDMKTIYSKSKKRKALK